jgi:hypothetical protein
MTKSLISLSFRVLRRTQDKLREESFLVTKICGGLEMNHYLESMEQPLRDQSKLPRRVYVR